MTPDTSPGQEPPYGRDPPGHNPPITREPGRVSSNVGMPCSCWTLMWPGSDGCYGTNKMASSKTIERSHATHNSDTCSFGCFLWFLYCRFLHVFLKGVRYSVWDIEYRKLIGEINWVSYWQVLLFFIRTLRVKVCKWCCCVKGRWSTKLV